MTNRNLRYSGLGLAVWAAAAIAACSSSDGPTGTPAAGAGNGTGGAHAAGGAGGSATAGTSAIAGNSGALAGGGAAGTGTTAGAGGVGGAGAGFVCAGTVPASDVITDFSNLVPNPASAGNYTFIGGMTGGTFAYQANALTVDPTGGVLNIKGNVKDYDGFGVFFNTCYNAGAYTGISFNIKGYAGPSGKLNLRVQTNANTAIDAKNSKGACVPTPGAASTYPDCHGASKDIPVTTTGAVVSVNFSDFTGGVPVPTVSANELLGLEWAFTYDPNAPTGTGGTGAGGAGGSGGKGGAGGSGGAPAAGTYDANVTIDDIKLIGGPPAGGAGGASSGGAGGASAGSGGTGGKGGAGGKAGSGG
ncbi:MAG: hypothetical protein WDO74_36200 [Pseudomonadota bacterium]